MNEHPRHATWPAGVLPRESIESVYHGHIDLSLKDLRTVSRHVAAFSTPYSDELKVLERIYYKGKNQHRTALFWRKVVEIRRLGARIIEMDMQELVERLRYSCYGDAGRTKSKSIRGAWKYTPNENTCQCVLKRLRSACCLVDRARRQFCLAQETFNRQLRTATFLPLAVSLIAITSRLEFLLVDVRSSIVSYWDAVMRILEVIPLPTGVKIDRRVLLLPAEVESARPRKRFVVKLKAEDLGNKIPRELVEGRPPELNTAGPVSCSPSIGHFGEHNSNPLSVARVAEGRSHQDMDKALADGAEPRNSDAPSGSHALHRGIRVKNERRGIDASDKALTGRTKKTKSRKKRDEIDDIFGF